MCVISPALWTSVNYTEDWRSTNERTQRQRQRSNALYECARRAKRTHRFWKPNSVAGWEESGAPFVNAREMKYIHSQSTNQINWGGGGEDIIRLTAVTAGGCERKNGYVGRLHRAGNVMRCGVFATQPRLVEVIWHSTRCSPSQQRAERAGSLYTDGTANSTHHNPIGHNFVTSSNSKHLT